MEKLLNFIADNFLLIFICWTISEIIQSMASAFIRDYYEAKRAYRAEGIKHAARQKEIESLNTILTKTGGTGRFSTNKSTDNTKS